MTNGGNRINEVQDYGIEIGGPLWKDKLFAWGAAGRNQINLFNAQGNPDNTTLIDYNAKVNLQLFDATSLMGTFGNGNKYLDFSWIPGRRNRLEISGGHNPV